MSYKLRFWLGGVLKTDPVFKQEVQKSGKGIGFYETPLTAESSGFTVLGDF